MDSYSAMVGDATQERQYGLEGLVQCEISQTNNALLDRAGDQSLWPSLKVARILSLSFWRRPWKSGSSLAAHEDVSTVARFAVRKH